METIKEILQIGKQHFDNKRYAQAEQYLRRVIDEHPHYADVFNMLGVIAHVEGKFATAVDCFDKALKINPRYTEAMLNLAVLYNDLGQYDKARELYSRLKSRKIKSTCQIEPVLRGKLSNLHADIGDIYRSIGLFGMAIDEYKKALALNPSYLDIRTKLGQALREHGFMNESLAELKEVLKNKALYGPALIQMGVTYYTMDNVSDAKKAWKKVLENEPNNEYAKMYLRLCQAIVTSIKSEKKKTSSKKKTKRTSMKSKGKKAKRSKKR
ncbi:MAG: tetratricopeptide repeat protein [Pseudomonadota bacterium]